MPTRKPPVAPRGKSGLLNRIGIAIWGANYLASMAACVERDPKQVRRWLDGEAPIPDYAWGGLRTKIGEHRAALRKLWDEIGEQL